LVWIVLVFVFGAPKASVVRIMFGDVKYIERLSEWRPGFWCRFPCTL
jgi:hypothetical protein